MKTFAEKNWPDTELAVAYSLNFVQMCFRYDSDTWSDFYESCCKHCSDYSIQKRDFECPKSGFSKKDYFILDTCDYGISEKVKNDLIDFGIDDCNFRPIYTRGHKLILGWQISPQYVLSPTYNVNGFFKKLICKECDFYKYERFEKYTDSYLFNGYGYPHFITKEALEQLNGFHLAYTSDKLCVYISKKIYQMLVQKYPRIECRPVFLGSIKEYSQSFL